MSELAGVRRAAVETKLDFPEELKKGNIAVAILVGAFIIGISIIIGQAVGG